VIVRIVLSGHRRQYVDACPSVDSGELQSHRHRAGVGDLLQTPRCAGSASTTHCAGELGAAVKPHSAATLAEVMAKHNSELTPVLDDRERQPDEEGIEAEGGERAHSWTCMIATTAVPRSFRIPQVWLATSATFPSRSKFVSFPLRLLVIVPAAAGKRGTETIPSHMAQAASSGTDLRSSARITMSIPTALPAGRARPILDRYLVAADQRRIAQ
jgi:hypothetical protein